MSLIECAELTNASENNDERLSDPIFQGREYLINPAVNGTGEDSNTPTTDIKKAQLVTSRATDGSSFHYPCFDIDIKFEKFRLVKSASGNTHLFINAPFHFDEMMALGEALAVAGLVDLRWLDHTRKAGYAYVRLPGVKKYGTYNA